MTTEPYRGEARAILNNLSSMPFEDCYPLSRKFEPIPTNPGLYAVRHRTEGILYIGKSINLRRRFCDGHKAFSWAFVDRHDPNDVRIAIEIFGLQSWQRAGDLETLMIRSVQPSYNSLIK
jgi:excinuclease UvrABC nuclease subunit